ncbi:MAG: hypothetical protein VW907_00290, partial [Opitutae bacterium]
VVVPVVSLSHELRNECDHPVHQQFFMSSGFPGFVALRCAPFVGLLGILVGLGLGVNAYFGLFA